VHSWVNWICTHEYFTFFKCYPDPHEYHILMGYLTSTCKCKETYEYSQVFSRELIEIIQLELSINIAIFEYLRWLKSFWGPDRSQILILTYIFATGTCTSTHGISQNQYLDPWKPINMGTWDSWVWYFINNHSR